MARYFRFLTVWLAFGVALGTLVLIGLGSSLDLQGEHGPEHLWPLLTVSAAGALVFGVTLGTISYRFQGTRAHGWLVDWFSRGMQTLLLVVILACVARVLFEVLPGFSGLGAVDYLDRFFGPAWATGSDLAGHLGTPPRVGSVPTAPVILGLLLIAGRYAVNWGVTQLTPHPTDGSLPVRSRGRRQRERDPEAERRAQAASRKVAVASYTEAKALLATTEMELTFLALDVVGSTRIKQGEDPYVIEQSFADYRKLVERMLRRHGAYKQTWTPDGQMAAFRSPQSAVDCGRDILLALPDFNANVSRMRSDFKLRVGANCGVVSCDDDIPMEEMSDFTIDVAGHMQKYADEDSMWISSDVYEQLADKSGFKSNGREVDERKVYVWKRPG